MAKKKITKEELEKLLSYRQDLIKRKQKEFAKVSMDCEKEYIQFNPCSKCKFISETCHKTCGIIMKWLSKNTENVSTHYGKTDRITSAAEYLDTSAVNPGLTEAVDKFIKDEINGAIAAEAMEIPMSELDEFEIADEVDE